jgi:hypothetical protein
MKKLGERVDIAEECLPEIESLNRRGVEEGQAV